VSRCPICRQPVYPTTNQNIFRHRDALGRFCPASGQPIRITYQEEM
jgi:hypothetical protein